VYYVILAVYNIDFTTLIHQKKVSSRLLFLPTPQHGTTRHLSTRDTRHATRNTPTNYDDRRRRFNKLHSSTLNKSVEECAYLLVAVIASSRSSGSAVVSLIHLKSPQQQEKFLQFDFNDARTMRPKKAKNAPESVSQNELPNSSYHAIYLTYVWRV